MKLQIFKLVALLALLTVWFSCTSDSNEPRMYRFQWDSSEQQEKFRPINLGEASSYFTIDSNVISFAVPYLAGTIAWEHPSEPNWGGSDSFSPHFWTINLILAEGIDVSSLTPVITLAPGVTMTQIHDDSDGYTVKQVDYTGIVEAGVFNFRKQVSFLVTTPDEQCSYLFLAVAIGDELPCSNCPN